MRKQLEILKLSIPAIGELSARQLLGGDGYHGYDPTDDTYGMHEMPELEVNQEWPEVDEPERWTGDPEEILEPDSGMDYEDWHPDEDDDRDDDDEYGDETPENTNEVPLDQAEEEAKLPELIAKLPASLQEFIKNRKIEIKIDVNLKNSDGTNKSGQYKEGVITLRTADRDYLNGELAHAIQDSLGLLNKADHAMNEFQEKLTRDLLSMIDDKLNIWGFNSCLVGFDEYEIWRDELSTIVDDGGVVNLQQWTESIGSRFDDFINRYKDEEKYQGAYDENYQYQWETFFEIFEIQYK